MSSSRRILINIASNWLGYAVNAGVTLLLTPLVLHNLGETRYGIWALTSSIVGYYGLLDFGLRGGVTQYLTKYIVRQDYVRAGECISSAVAALSAVGVLLCFFSFLAGAFAESIFNIPPEYSRETFWCIAVVGITSSFQCAFFPFGAVYTAVQRFDVANGIGIFSRFALAAGVYFSVTHDKSLIGISIATCSGNLLDYLLRWVLHRRIAPGVRFSFKSVRVDRLKEIWSFGAWNFIISLSTHAYQHLQSIILGIMMPVAVIARFAMAVGVISQIKDLLFPIGYVLYPTAVEFYERRENERLKQLYFEGTRLMMVIVCVCVELAYFWADDFYRLWIGNAFLEGGSQSVPAIMRVMLIWVVLQFSTNIGVQILFGAGRIKLVAFSSIAVALMTGVLSIFLIEEYGLVGAAWASVFSSFLGRLLFVPIALHKTLSLSVAGFVQSTFWRPTAVCGLLVPVANMIRQHSGADTWVQLIGQGAMFICAAAVIATAVGLKSNEREKFIITPMREVLRGLKPSVSVDK